MARLFIMCMLNLSICTRADHMLQSPITSCDGKCATGMYNMYRIFSQSGPEPSNVSLGNFEDFASNFSSHVKVENISKVKNIPNTNIGTENNFSINRNHCSMKVLYDRKFQNLLTLKDNNILSPASGDILRNYSTATNQALKGITILSPVQGLTARVDIRNFTSIAADKVSCSNQHGYFKRNHEENHFLCATTAVFMDITEKSDISEARPSVQATSALDNAKIMALRRSRRMAAAAAKTPYNKDITTCNSTAYIFGRRGTGSTAEQAGPRKELLAKSDILPDGSNNMSGVPHGRTKNDQLGLSQAQQFGPLHGGAIVATLRRYYLGLLTAAPSKACSALHHSVTTIDTVAGIDQTTPGAPSPTGTGGACGTCTLRSPPAPRHQSTTAETQLSAGDSTFAGTG